jgi:hypothetical protein
MQDSDPGGAQLATSPLLFGSKLVRAGLASPEQVDECLEIQRRSRTPSGACRRLGDIMIERGYVSARQIHAFLNGEVGVTGTRFGEVCLRLGLLNPGQLEAALLSQQQLRAAGRERHLGQLLAEMRLITAADVSSVLKIQGLESTECSKCRIDVNVPAGCPAADLRCPRCGRTLIYATEFEEVILDEDARRH